MMTKTITLSIDDLKNCDKIVINIIKTNNGEELQAEYDSDTHDDNLGNLSFSDFTEKEIKRLSKEKKFNTANGYKSALNNYMRFLEKDNVYLKDINTDNLKRFEYWMRQRNLFANTISFYFRKLRAIHNKMSDIYKIKDSTPFKYVYTGKANTAKRAIGKSDIIKIKKLQTESPSKQFAIDMFMLSFFLRGISFVDMAHLKRENIKNGILSYKRKKTGQILHIRWEPCMEDIVCKYSNKDSQYLLPIINNTRKGKEFNKYRGKLYEINKNLKEVGHTLKFSQPLTMYVARHSWASIAKQLGIPLSIISYGMGHDSEKTTDIYLKTLDYNKIDMANAKIIHEITLKGKK